MHILLNLVIPRDCVPTPLTSTAHGCRAGDYVLSRSGVGLMQYAAGSEVC